MTTTKKLSFILLIAAIAVISGCVKSLPKEQGSKPVENAATTNEVNNATTTEPVATASSTKDWLTYRNEEYGFEVKYPKEWTIVNPQSDKEIRFYGEYWKNEKDEFKKSLVPSDMSITFKDNIDNLEKWLLQRFGGSKYKTMQEMVDKEIDIFSYSKTIIDNMPISVLSLGAELPYNNYYMESKIKGSYIIVDIIDGHKLENQILSTIKIY